jgi:hypothetical protein
MLRDRLLEALELGWRNEPAGGNGLFSSDCMISLGAFATTPED